MIYSSIQKVKGCSSFLSRFYRIFKKLMKGPDFQAFFLEKQAHYQHKSHNQGYFSITLVKSLKKRLTITFFRCMFYT